MGFELGHERPIEQAGFEVRHERQEMQRSEAPHETSRAREQEDKRRQFRREREITIAQVKQQIAEAQSEQRTLQEQLDKVESGIVGRQNELAILKQGLLGWLKNRTDIQEMRLAVAGESAMADQLKQKIQYAKRYQEGMATHLANLLRKHEADKAQPENSPEQIAAK